MKAVRPGRSSRTCISLGDIENTAGSRLFTKTLFPEVTRYPGNGITNNEAVGFSSEPSLVITHKKERSPPENQTMRLQVTVADYKIGAPPTAYIHISQR